MDERFTVYGSFTSSSSYKPMLFLALARVPYAFRSVNLKIGAQQLPGYLAVNRYGQVPALCHRGFTIVQSNVIFDYLARVTGSFDGENDADRWRAGERAPLGGEALQEICRVGPLSRFRAGGA